MRTLEEIGELFGDKVAAHYYGTTEEEKEEIRRQAMKMTEDGRILDDSGEITPVMAQDGTAEKAAVEMREEGGKVA